VTHSHRLTALRALAFAGALCALAACGSVPQNPLADSGQITVNPTTGQASAAAQPAAPANADPLTQLAFAIGNTYGPDDANAMNLATGSAPGAPVDPVGLACWTDLANVSNALSMASGAGAPGTGGGVLTDLEELRLQLLAFQGGGQANPLLMKALNDCIAMGQQTVAMGKALPLEFQNLMNQLLITAMQTPGGGGLLLVRHPAGK
jgi:hypothetical protein